LAPTRRQKKVFRGNPKKRKNKTRFAWPSGDQQGGRKREKKGKHEHKRKKAPRSSTPPLTKKGKTADAISFANKFQVHRRGRRGKKKKKKIGAQKGRERGVCRPQSRTRRTRRGGKKKKRG